MTQFYVPSVFTAENPQTQNLAHLSPVSSGLMAFQKRKGAGTVSLSITVIEGRNLPVMDPNGKSDPYCIVQVGGQEQMTKVQHSTVNPKWKETFKFEVSTIPQLADSDDHSATCCLVHYAQIDIWDKDTLNRDDFMGRIMIPISTLREQPTSGWYPLGRATPKDDVSGEISLEIKLLAKQSIPRWNKDDELLSLCKKRTGFELPFVSGESVLDFPGEAEHVEMVLDDVVVEVSKHRGIGRVYLTDFRLVILCNTSSHIGVGHCDMSMWVALNNIQAVDKGEDEKVVRRTAGGNAAFADVKTLTIRCLDFRTIYLTFMNSHKPTQGMFFLPTGSSSSQSSPDSIPSSAHQMAIGEGVDNSDQKLLDVTVPELERLNSGDGGRSPFPNDRGMEDITRSSSHSSFQILSKSSSSGSVEGLISGPGVLGVACMAGTTSLPEKLITNDAYSANFLPFYVNVLYQRIAFHILNAMDNPPSKTFVKYHSSDIQLDCWSMYDYEKEFTRQGISEKWRISRANLDFTICHSYPKFLVVPEDVKDATLKESALFRCKGRIAALSWFNSKKGNFIMRCAQPKTGAMGKYSTEDEDVIRIARLCNPNSDRLVIFDARSMMAASGNMLMGKGTEDTINRYQGCNLVFLDIPNIHAVRDSIERLQAVCGSSSQKKWLSHLESTQWLAYIAAILKGATTIARFIEKGVSTLVHCSDGWDRTSQLTSLAQLLLDPYYRTFTGFQVLIDKEWISFGHRFRDRLGHPSCPSQRSPIFLQFLDCVWQILRQFPTAFEFTSDFILRIADHVNSQWFGNFLHNNVRDRYLQSANRLMVSLWSHLTAIQDGYKNALYTPCSEALMPASSLRRLQLWTDYFLRYDETAWSAADVMDIDEETNPSQLKNQPNTVVWVPDERVKECHDCKQRFTRFKRKHHCRACGQVFCGDCSKQKIILPQFGYTNPERVCESCFQQNNVTTKEEEVRSRDKEEETTLVKQDKRDGEVNNSDSSVCNYNDIDIFDDDDDDDDDDDENNDFRSNSDTDSESEKLKCYDDYF